MSKSLTATASLHHLAPDYYPALTGPHQPRNWPELRDRLAAIHDQLLVTLTQLADLATTATGAGDTDLAGEFLAAARPYRDALTELEYLSACPRRLGALRCTQAAAHPGGCTYESATGSQVPDRHSDD